MNITELEERIKESRRVMIKNQRLARSYNKIIGRMKRDIKEAEKQIRLLIRSEKRAAKETRLGPLPVLRVKGVRVRCKFVYDHPVSRWDPDISRYEKALDCASTAYPNGFCKKHSPDYIHPTIRGPHCGFPLANGRNCRQAAGKNNVPGYCPRHEIKENEYGGVQKAQGQTHHPKGQELV